jgi:diazepam-binding inhibitor (GABA receptor modulator, acyl-CoA-binding protein)
MSDLDARFEQAQADIKNITARPSNDDLRELYGLYKQATVGDAATSGARRPGRLDLLGRAKYDAWTAKAGLSADDAKQAYIDVVARLLG